jgi:hypothetical protein
VKSVTTMPPVGIGARQASVNLKLKCITNGAEAVRTQIIKARLIDAKGREVGEPNGYGTGMGVLVKGEQNVDSYFHLSAPQWNKLAKPLTFQAIVSVNDGWPEEVNVELGKANAVLPAKKSRLPFLREPLPPR